MVKQSYYQNVQNVEVKNQDKYKMNEIVNQFLSAGYKFMPEMGLK